MTKTLQPAATCAPARRGWACSR